MSKTIIFLFTLIPVIAFSQTREVKLIIAGGASFHSTGDMNGYSFLNQVDIAITKHMYLSPGVQFTNHSYENKMTYFKVNYVSAGLNILTNLNYYLLNNVKHQFAMGGGPIVRLQNSSVPVETSSSLGSSGQPELGVKYGKLRTISIGYNFSPAYYYQCCKKMSIGVKLVVQNDTEGDLITSYCAFVGLRL